MFVILFFFFQAEDGIRDLTVTGVQTCALPISSQIRNLRFDLVGMVDVKVIGPANVVAGNASVPAVRVDTQATGYLNGADRESVVEGKSVDLGGRRIIKKKKKKRKR